MCSSGNSHRSVSCMVLECKVEELACVICRFVDDNLDKNGHMLLMKIKISIVEMVSVEVM